MAPGFERVRDVSGDNFENNGDVGAALCVYRHGRKVVDLWGGLADSGTGRPWARDTLQLVYSATKAATATCAHLLAQRGELDLDRPAAHYWPEFAASGKGGHPGPLAAVAPGRAAGHRPSPAAGRPAGLGPDGGRAGRPAAGGKPGTAHGYHGRTFGWLVGEVIRRIIRPQRGDVLRRGDRRASRALFWIGLAAAERGRVSRMVIDDPPGAEVAAIPLDQIPEQFRPLVAAFTDPDSLMNRAFALSTPDIDFNAPEGTGRRDPVEQRDLHRGRTGPADAGPISEVDGVRVRMPPRLPAAIAEQAFGPDRVLLVPSRFASGFMLPTQESPLGRPGLVRPSGARRVARLRRPGEAASRSATWSATSGRTWPITEQGCWSRPSGPASSRRRR